MAKHSVGREWNETFGLNELNRLQLKTFHHFPLEIHCPRSNVDGDDCNSSQSLQLLGNKPRQHGFLLFLSNLIKNSTKCVNSLTVAEIKLVYQFLPVSGCLYQLILSLGCHLNQEAWMRSRECIRNWNKNEKNHHILSTYQQSTFNIFN